LILLLEKSESYWRDDPEWLKGMAKGCTGYFPANRVTPVHNLVPPTSVKEEVPPSIEPEPAAVEPEPAAVEPAPPPLTGLNKEVEETFVLPEIVDFERLSEEEIESLSPEEVTLYRSREALVEAQRILISQQVRAIFNDCAACSIEACVSAISRSHSVGTGLCIGTGKGRASSCNRVTERLTKAAGAASNSAQKSRRQGDSATGKCSSSECWGRRGG
jgi:hypothetical protein